MADKNLTFDKLISGEEDARVNDMHYSNLAFGDITSLDREDIVDTFMTRNRYFETNLASTINQGSDIKDFTDEEKKIYSRARDTLDELPSAFSSSGGGAPMWGALKDYAIAGVTDPTNILSIIAGAFTLGSGSAAAFAGKEAVKQGVKATLKAKFKALGTKGVQRALAAEGLVAGTGGAISARQIQNVDMDIGRRKDGDYDYGAIALQGLAETIISPLAGVGINIGGTAVAGATRETLKQANKAQQKVTGFDGSIAAQRSKDFLAKWLLPQGGVDATTARLLELNENAFRPIREAAEKVGFDIDQAYKKDFIKGGDSIDLINKAMEGDVAARELVSEQSPAMKKALDDFINLRETTYGAVRDPSIQTSDHLQNIWKKNPNYLRDIYDRYTLTAREPFDKFINRAENQNLVPDLIRAAEKFDPELGVENIGVKLGILTREGKSKGMSLDQIQKIIKQEVKHQYVPDLNYKSKLGALKSKDPTLDPLMKQIWGRNANPAIRATETIMGIVDPVTDIRLASSLSDSLLARGLAVRGNARFTDPSKSPDDYVKLISKKDYGKRPGKFGAFSKTEVEASPMSISSKLYSEELEDVYIPKELAGKLNVMLQDQGRRTDTGINVLLNTMAATQGYLKKGKTVYSPYAHARNFLGMLQYTANSGNLRGLTDYFKTMRNLKNPEQQLDFKDKMSRLGVTGSAVELNQILSRIEGAADDPNKLSRIFTGLGSLGVSELERTAAGKKFSKKLTDVYSGTDNVGKVMTFLSERRKAANVWKEMSEASRDEARSAYAKSFGKERPNPFNTSLNKQFDEGLIDEMAVQKALDVVPVYSRIPKILETMRGVPILGSFTAFPAENLRNKYKILKLGSEELRDGFQTNNKALIKTGANRLLSQGAFAGATTGAAYVYNEVKGTDKAMDMVRKSMPEWMKYHALQVRPGDDGKLYVTDLSYLNPDQYVLDMIMPLMVSAANGEDVSKTLDSGLKSIIENMYKPFIETSLLTNFIMDMSKLVTTDDPDVVERSIVNMYKTAEPGALKVATELLGDAGIGSKGWRRSLDPLYYGEERGSFKDSTDITNKFSRYGLQLGAGGLGLTLKEQVIDPKKQMAFTARALMGDANKKWTSTIGKLKTNLRSPDYSKDILGLLSDYNEALEEQYMAQQGVADLTSSYINYYGLAKTKKLLFDKEVKQAGRLSTVEINHILQNKFEAPKIPATFWSDLKTSNPEYSAGDITKIRREFNKLNKLYQNKQLGEEVPGYEFTIKE